MCLDPSGLPPNPSHKFTSLETHASGNPSFLTFLTLSPLPTILLVRRQGKGLLAPKAPLRLLNDFLDLTVANSCHLIQPDKASKCVGTHTNHQKCPEQGPFGSIWADTGTESILRGLGCLSDPQPQLKNKTTVFGFRGSGPPIPLRGPKGPMGPFRCQFAFY